MKRLLLLTTTSLLLVLPDIAIAQGHDHRPGGGATTRPAPSRPGNPGGGHNPGGNKPSPARPSPVRPSPGSPDSGHPGGGRPQPGRPDAGRPNPGRPNPGRPTPGRPTPGRPQPGRPGNSHRPGIPHRPGTGRPPNFRPIHRPTFRYPHGYHYRRWTIGLFLPSLFLSSSYYFNDWSDVGVGPPPPGYRWVRYGPDLLLVQIGTRRVADVIYGAFY